MSDQVPENIASQDDLLAQLYETREALRQSELRTQMLAEVISDYAYVYQLFPDGSIRYEWASEAFRRISGYSDAELATLGWEAMIDPADQPLIQERYAAIRAGRPDERIWRVHLKDGRIRRILDSCRSMRDENSGSIRVYGASQDVTERYEAEQLALQQRFRLEATFGAITDAIGVYNTDGHFVLMNTAMRALLNLDAATDLHTLSIQERTADLHLCDEQGQALPPSQTPVARILRGEVLQGNQAAELRLTSYTGQERQVSVSGAPIYNDQYEIIGGVLVVRDVSARRDQERRTGRALNVLLALAEVTARFSEYSLSPQQEETIMLAAATNLLEWTRELFGCQTASLFLLHSDGFFRPVDIVGLSPKARKLFLRTFAQLSLDEYHTMFSQGLPLQGGSVLVDFTRPENAHFAYDGVKNVLVAPVRLGERQLGALSLNYDNMQHIFPLDQEASLMEGIARLAAVAIDREQLLRDRLTTQADELALREANRQMDEFLSMASHELRSPLTAIKGGLQMVRRLFRRRAHELPLADLISRAEEMLSRAEHQVAVEVRLVDDLLDVSRIQNNKLELHLRQLNLRDLVSEVVSDQQASAENRQFTLNLPHQPSVLVRADGDRLGQVLNNFLTNAVKYSPEGTPIVIRLELVDRGARVSVRDRGPGLTVEQQERIWERFYQVAERRSGGPIGLGLGLYISQSIMEQHHGQIGVESEPGRGAVFWFTLPLLTES